MHCVVTAGPAFEPIDRVRRLTNFSTGRLGTALAHYLAHQGHVVTLFRGETSSHSQKPEVDDLITFSTSADLRHKIEQLHSKEVDAFYHVAAVGDFACGGVWTRSQRGEMKALHEGKISSRQEGIYLELVPAPKILSCLRDFFPQAYLVGWKYEVEGERESLLTKAATQIQENRTNACVVNGPAYGEGFGWVVPSGTPRHLVSEQVLFGVLEQSPKPSGKVAT